MRRIRRRVWPGPLCGGPRGVIHRYSEIRGYLWRVMFPSGKQRALRWRIVAEILCPPYFGHRKLSGRGAGWLCSRVLNKCTLCVFSILLFAGFFHFCVNFRISPEFAGNIHARMAVCFVARTWRELIQAAHFQHVCARFHLGQTMQKDNV